MSENTPLQLTIARIDEPLFSGEVASVSVPSINGILEIFPRHEALITPLKTGTVVVKKSDDSQESFTVESGTLEVSHNQATILI